MPNTTPTASAILVLPVATIENANSCPPNANNSFSSASWDNSEYCTLPSSVPASVHVLKKWGLIVTLDDLVVAVAATNLPFTTTQVSPWLSVNATPVGLSISNAK